MDWNIAQQCLWLLLAAAVHNVHCHVSLTFPTARNPPLDFLDNVRTEGPCGVPRPAISVFTTLYTNTDYTFTWRMQYPHQGGLKLTLLDRTGKRVQNLTEGFTGKSDQTAESFGNVSIDRECLNCTVLLERQAQEWGASYLFRSCADVYVLSNTELSDRERCSNEGSFENGRCKCDVKRSGNLCQYIDDCSTNAHCLNGGVCVHESGSLSPRTCFCQMGYFGKNCDQTFAAHDTEKGGCFNYHYPMAVSKFNMYGLFNVSCFHRSVLSPSDYVFFRTVQDEMEVVMDYEGTSWIALGWRPLHANASCRQFPDLSATPLLLYNAEPEPVPEKEPTSASEAEPETEPEAKSVLSAQSKEFHPMDCMDIIVGAVNSGRQRVIDHYTRDRSTPLPDQWYGGRESLTAAYGLERDGRTIIMFRRKIKANDKADNDMDGGKKFVIWAKGQEAGKYSHSPPSALENGPVSNPRFYKPDQLKYHGKRNRGINVIRFVRETEPSGGTHTSSISILFCFTLLPFTLYLL